MFLVMGLLTMALAGVVLLVMPDNPMSARLSHAEKVVAVERLRGNQTGIENKHFKGAQMRECFSDVQTWLLCAITVSSSVSLGPSAPEGQETKHDATDSERSRLVVPSDHHQGIWLHE